MKSYLKLFVAVFFILAVIRTVHSQYYSVSGTVRYADNYETVTSGTVCCYDASTCELLGTAVIQPSGDYILWFIRHAHDADVIGFGNNEPEADWVPTGYPDKTDPEQYTRLNIDQDLYGINIYVQRQAYTGGSPLLSSVSGLILDMNKKPVSGAIVYATRGGEYYGYGVTDAKGNYRIENIPTGDYIIIAHKIAHQSDSKPVFVNENGLTNLNLLMNKSNSNLNMTAPSEFSLTQNYPNPFNPSTTIKYSLPVSGMVSLKVYNTVGQEVSSIVNEFQEAGEYNISFNASNLASGVYYYKLSAGSYNDTKKMTLIK